MVERVSMDEVRKRKSRSKTGIKGSKPTPLKVSKDSHNCTKIKPVIIYLRSPEVIHTQPKDFMAVVQRLTGFSSSSSSCTQPREDFTALQTNPKVFCPLEEEGAAISQVTSPPWNSLAEELELDMNWDPELQLFSPPPSQLFDFPFTMELQSFNCLYDTDNPYIINIDRANGSPLRL